MGSIDIFLPDAACVGDDHVMPVVPSNDGGNLVVVDDDYVTSDAIGDYFTFDCTPEIRFCIDDRSAMANTDRSSLKALYKTRIEGSRSRPRPPGAAGGAWVDHITTSTLSLVFVCRRGTAWRGIADGSRFPPVRVFGCRAPKNDTGTPQEER